MPFVLTVDQIHSRRGADAVDAILAELTEVPTALPFTRTVGDEFQGLLGTGTSVLDAILVLMRSTSWHIGLGVGPVEHPLPPDDPRRARGPAFVAARAAVERAKADPRHLAVVALPTGQPEADDVDAVLGLLAAVRARRTESGWAAADLASQGLTQAETAARLGITRQAVQQRLQAAQWTSEESARRTLVRLLDRTDAVTAVPTGGSA